MTDRTFGWQKKLRKTDEFSSVFHFRCSQRGKALDVSAAPNNLGFARLGMIVPKRVIVTAVGRNRIKRLLREWFRQTQEELVGLDVIVRLKGKSGANFAAETSLRQDFLSGLGACQACVNGRRPVPNDSD